MTTVCCACAAFAPAAHEEELPQLIIYSTRPLSITDNVLARFEADTGIDVTCVTLRTSDALIRIEGEQNDPRADILWPVTLETVQHKEALFSSLRTYSYTPTALMVNTDTAAADVVRGYEALLEPQYKGRIAFADPSVSSASYAHLVNMLYAMGDGNPQRGWDYVEKFCAQLDGNVLQSDEEVYQGVACGYYSVGLTFAETSEELMLSGAHVKTSYMEEGVIFHKDAVCRVKDAPHEEAAELFEQWIMNERTQVYLQKSQYQTNLYSLRDLMIYGVGNTGIHMIGGNERIAAALRNDWIKDFDTLVKQ